MNARIRVPSASMTRGIMMLLVLTVIAVILMGILYLIPSIGVALALIVLGLYLIILVFYPIIQASDVSDRLPEVVAIKKANKEISDVSIRHQYFWAIVIIDILFGATIIGYVIAFVMAHMPCDADVPALLLEKVNLTETKPPVIPISLEDKIKEVDALVQRKVLSPDEARVRRDNILRS
jgi:Ca2+/Na+ antiporter